MTVGLQIATRIRAWEVQNGCHSKYALRRFDVTLRNPPMLISERPDCVGKRANTEDFHCLSVTAKSMKILY